MKQKQLITLSYFTGFLIVIAILVKLNLNLTQLLSEATSFDAIIDAFNTKQKQLATTNIVTYFILLSISLWALSTEKKINYILLSLIVFIGVTLYNSVSLNKALFALKGLNPSNETGYWLMVFIGVFYIIGAVVIAAIGYIAVKNYSKRNQKLKS